MITCTIKCLIFGFVFACFLQEIIHANESNDYAKEIVYTYNSQKKNVGHENFTKLTLDKHGNRVPFLSNIFENSPPENISSRCKDGLITYYNDFLSLKPWALEMFDATGKPPSSNLIGTVQDFGSSEECVGIIVHSEDESFLFKGKYCMIHMQHPLFQPSVYKTENGKDYADAFGVPPDWIRHFVDEDISKQFGLYLGVCIPSACTEEDLHSIKNAIAEPMAVNVTITDCVEEKGNEPKQWPLSTKLAFVLLASFLILCVIETSLELLDGEQLGRMSETDRSVNREVLKSFSIYRNVKKIFTSGAKKTPLDCLNGLRVAYCLWVVLGHSAGYPTIWKDTRYRDLIYVHEFITPELIMVIFNNGLIVVEGFFYISGFLLMFHIWRMLEQSNGNIDILGIIVSRYLRMTPAHLFVIMISFLLPTLSSGPGWDSTWKRELGNCLNNGWKNVLYSQNFANVMDVCWGHTWYIGVAMQSIVISVPLMVVLYKYPKLGIFVSLIIMFGSMIVTYKTNIEQGFGFCGLNHERLYQRGLDFISTVYMHTAFHLPPNLVGMFSGWIVLKYGNRKLSKVWLIIGWLFCALCFVVSVYGVYIPKNWTEQRIGVLYTTTRNSIFALGLSWLVYACASGNGGVIDKVLSWKALAPLGQISYCSYLVHPLLLEIREGALTERWYMDKITHVVELIPYFLMTFIFAFILYVTVEEPCNQVSNLLLMKRRTTSKQKSSAHLQPSTSEDKISGKEALKINYINKQ